MDKTTVGLPNTCAGCAQPITVEEGWYAENDDAAKAGVGFHSLQCAAKYPELSGYNPPKKAAPKPKKEVKLKPKTVPRKPRKAPTTKKT